MYFAHHYVHSRSSVYVWLRCEAMSFPEKQAREAWTSTGEEEGEEEGNEEEKEPAIVDRV